MMWFEYVLGWVIDLQCFVMKSKLKKKTKAFDIIFPHSFHKKSTSIGELNDQASKINEAQKEEKSKSLMHNHKSLKRSFSVQNRNNKPLNAWLFQESKVVIKQPVKRKGSLLKKGKHNQSSAQISSLFYQTMQKNLARQCEMILKMQKPVRSQSSCKLNNIAQNFMLLHRTKKQKAVRGQTKQKKKTQYDKFLQKAKAMTSIKKIEGRDSLTQSEFKINNQYDKVCSEVQVCYSQSSEHEMARFGEEILRRSSLVVPRKTYNNSQSLVQAKIKNKKLILALAQVNGNLISSKFIFKSAGFFTIVQIEPQFKQQNELLIFFQFGSELVYKIIQAGSQKRLTDVRSRKFHAKKFQNIRDKLKEKVFSHFTRASVQNQVSLLFKDILDYMEQCLFLQRTYRGLTLLDYEQSGLSLYTNQQKINEMLRVNRSIYFTFKLGSSYYLVKGSSSITLQIKLILLIDFTTFSAGDQLSYTFSFPSYPYQLNHRKLQLLLPKLIPQFNEVIRKEWLGQQHKKTQDDQLPEKITKITKSQVQSLEWWSGKDVDKLWNCNKKFQMTGKIKNYFVFHDHFDYGFFNKSNKYFRIQNCWYNLLKNNTLNCYCYPQQYKQIILNQKQMEALVISHLPPLSQSFRKITMKSFLKRREVKKQRLRSNQFKIFMRNYKITITINTKIIIDFEDVKKFKNYKLIMPIESVNKKDQLNINKINVYLQSIFQNYKIRKSLLYSSMTKVGSQRVMIYYKGLHKFQGQYAFVSLYKIIALELIQFKIYTFQMGRSFVVQLQGYDLHSQTVKATVNNLVGVFKNVYFKKMLQQQASKSKKRRKDALQDFFKHRLKVNANTLRTKRKQEEEQRKNMIRLASMKCTVGSNLIYEEITTRFGKNQRIHQFYITLRYLPVEQLQESGGLHQQYIEICLHKQRKLEYFRHVSFLKDLASRVISKDRLDQFQSRNTNVIFRLIADKLVEIVSTSQTLQVLTIRLKKFLIFKYHQKDYPVHPIKYKLIGTDLFETEQTPNQSFIIPSALSLDVSFEKRVSAQQQYISNVSIIDISNTKQLRLQHNKISINAKQYLSFPYITHVHQNWIIQVIDTFCPSEQNLLHTRSRHFERKIRVIDRQSEKCFILSDWEGYFIGDINYNRFNKRMITRVLRALRLAL